MNTVAIDCAGTEQATHITWPHADYLMTSQVTTTMQTHNTFTALWDPSCQTMGLLLHSLPAWATQAQSQGAALSKKASIYQVTMLATCKNILFPGHNHLLTTGTDDLTLWISPEHQWVFTELFCKDFSLHSSEQILVCSPQCAFLHYIPSVCFSYRCTDRCMDKCTM